MHVGQTTQKDLCCGCGICATACPVGAIQIKLNRNLEWQPVIDEEACIDCGACLRVCPFSKENLLSRSFASWRCRGDYGVGTDHRFIQGVDSDPEGYEQSASGGMLSALLCFLLDRGEVDAVVHAETVAGTEKARCSFRAAVSRNSNEVHARRGSVYAPVEFSRVLDKIEKDSRIRHVAFVGTPCAISGLRNLRRVKPDAARKIRFCLALICSHNVSGQFARTLMADLGEQKGFGRLVFRNKTQIANKNCFNNAIVYDDGKVVQKKRFASSYTEDWRNHCYAFSPCLSCPDFWGAEADASFKDSWGVSDVYEKRGETVGIVRSFELMVLLDKAKDAGCLQFVGLGHSMLVRSQRSTAIVKYLHARRQVRKVARKRLRKERSWVRTGALFWAGLARRLKQINIAWSKRRFREKSKRLPVLWRRFSARLIRISEALAVKLISALDAPHRRKESLSILYAAGFGSCNHGDEAQLAENLRAWREIVPDCRLVVLSPNPRLTRRLHRKDIEVIKAPRCTLWGVSGISYGGIKNHPAIFGPFFIWRYVWARLSALFLRITGRTFLGKPDNVRVLQALREADVFHIGGGGFLTGKTASRLLDHMAMIRLARDFGTDVILSGQTIGVWQSAFQRAFARQLRYAWMIGVRDAWQSVGDLRSRPKVGGNSMAK